MNFREYGHLLSRSSLTDLDDLPECFPQPQQRLTLQYIQSFCDIPQPSEPLEAIGRPNHDCFRSEMEGIAFNKQDQPTADPDLLSLSELDNVSTSMNSDAPAEPSPKRTGCSCKKTGCLKMYCECFASGLSCGSECGCLNCHNHSEHTEVI